MKRKLTKNKRFKIAVSVCFAAAFATVWLILCGYLWSWGPFSDMSNIRFGKLAGNSEKYSLEQIEPLDSSPLSGKKICYLGSSVTYGASSLQTSFVEYISVRNKSEYVKEAVSGTTLVDGGADSYISRMKKLDKSEHFDLFVCQLSTNDATQKKPLGELSADGNFDTSTVCGAIEYIIDYVGKTWGCPVVFYTNAYYDSEEYSAMVSLLYDIQKNYDIGIIDMYTDREFNAVSDEKRKLYMADKIHPTKAGYLEWWTPKMEAEIYNCIKRGSGK